MKKQEKKLKPRNPIVAPAFFRKAGWTEKSGKAQRRDDKVALRRDREGGKSYFKDFFQASTRYLCVLA
jgi:hypothetical protein